MRAGRLAERAVHDADDEPAVESEKMKETIKRDDQ
jgi:hypothetical protein